MIVSVVCILYSIYDVDNFGMINIQILTERIIENGKCPL